MELSAAGVTATEADPLTEPRVALTVADPGSAPIARPLLPCTLLMVAFADDEVAHVTSVVRFSVLPSE